MSGPLPIRQGATHKVVLGPVVAVGDGFTPVTTLALSTADEAEVILHDNGTVVDISGYTFAAITTADGYYHLTLQSGISNTVGHMTVVVNDDSLCLPVKADFVVLEEAVYDMLYASGATGIPDYGAYVPTGPAPLFGVVEAGTAQSATSTTLVLRAATVDGSIQAGMTLLVFGSTQGYWQSVMIDSFSADTATITAWPEATPSGTITYLVVGSPTVSTSVLPPVNVVQISGDATAADNAEAFFDGTGYAGTNNVMPSVTNVTGGINTGAGTITTLDELDTAQDTQHSTTQGSIATAQTDLDVLTGTDGATLATSQPNYAPATAAALATVDGIVDTMVLGTITGSAVTGTLSTTAATTDLTGYADDQLIGRIITWTSGVCEGEQTDITDYASTNGTLTFTALTTAPENGDTFKIT